MGVFLETGGLEGGLPQDTAEVSRWEPGGGKESPIPRGPPPEEEPRLLLARELRTAPWPSEAPAWGGQCDTWALGITAYFLGQVTLSF